MLAFSLLLSTVYSYVQFTLKTRSECKTIFRSIGPHFLYLFNSIIYLGSVQECSSQENLNPKIGEALLLFYL